MKVEFEVKEFSEENLINIDNACKSIEIARGHTLSKVTTLGELASLYNQFNYTKEG